MRLQHHQDHILHGVDANPVEGKDSDDKDIEADWEAFIFAEIKPGIEMIGMLQIETGSDKEDEWKRKWTIEVGQIKKKKTIIICSWHGSDKDEENKQKTENESSWVADQEHVHWTGANCEPGIKVVMILELVIRNTCIFIL